MEHGVCEEHLKHREQSFCHAFIIQNILQLNYTTSGRQINPSRIFEHCIRSSPVQSPGGFDKRINVYVYTIKPKPSLPPHRRLLEPPL